LVRKKLVPKLRSQSAAVRTVECRLRYRWFDPLAHSFIRLIRDVTKEQKLGAIKKAAWPFFEIALVLVRFDHVARFIVNATSRRARLPALWKDSSAIGEDPEKFKAFVNAAERKNGARA